MQRRTAALAVSLGAAALLCGCSKKEHLPTAPAALAPVTRGTMVARLEGAPWQSTSVVTASLSGSGASSFFDILAGATDWNVEMSVPGYAHAGTTYTLGKTNLCQATVWVPGTFGGYTTLIPPYVGTVTITAIDSSHIAGDFAFVALGSSGVLHVTEGGFDAIRDPWSEASEAEAAVAARHPAR